MVYWIRAEEAEGIRNIGMNKDVSRKYGADLYVHKNARKPRNFVLIS